MDARAGRGPREAGDREWTTESLLDQATAVIERSDALGIARLEKFVRQAEALHQPHFDYLAATRRATLALIAGDMVAFDRHLDEARGLALAHDEPDAYLVESAQIAGRDMLLGRHRDSIEFSRRAYSGRVY